MKHSTLLRDTYSLSSATSGLGVLTTDTKTPIVPQPTVVPDLLQSLQVISQLHVESIRHNLGILPILVILLPIQKPVRDLKLPGVCNNGHEIVQLLCSQFTSPLVHVDISLLANNVSETPSNTLDGGQSKHNLLLSINVGVQYTQNVLKVFVRHQRHFDLVREDERAREVMS